MPLIERFISSHGAEVGVWQIEETLDWYCSAMPNIMVPKYRRNEHLLEFFAVRALFHELGYQPAALSHHGNGHPVFPSKFVSLTHCFPLVAVAISSLPVGIDVQKPVAKLERIMPRYLNEHEIEMSASNPDLPLWLWSAKEVIFKKFPLMHLAFKDQISLQELGSGSLRFKVGNQEFTETVSIYNVRGQVLAVS